VVSVVIPARDAAGTLGGQLEALATQERSPAPFEVVVADNGSTDGTPELADRWRQRLPVRVVDASGRRGAGHARNVGTAAARGELVAYCDADDVVAPDWLHHLVEAAATADLVGGALEHDALNEVATEWRGRDGAEALPRPLGFLPAAISANCAVRRPVWERIGGWNLAYTHGGDDVDFSWRAQLAGFRLAFAPRALVHYRRRATMRGVGRQVYDYARADVRLYRDFRAFGAARRPARSMARSLLYPLTRAPLAVVSRRRRGYWVVVTATVAGHVSGSVHQRALYL